MLTWVFAAFVVCFPPGWRGRAGRCLLPHAAAARRRAGSPGEAALGTAGGARRRNGRTVVEAFGGLRGKAVARAGGEDEGR